MNKLFRGLSARILAVLVLAGTATITTAITAWAADNAHVAHTGHVHDHTGNVPASSHAPIGVMGDHMHGAGEWMLSYRYMNMQMKGMRDGTDHLTPAQVLASGYMVTPLSMQTQMHMFGAMYAPSDRLTLMAMLPYVIKEMGHVTGMAARFTTRARGLGDAKLGGLWRLYDDATHHVHLNAGFSVPTGSVNQRDDTPAAANAKLPYPMQLGSGTWDLRPGVTYTGAQARWGWGAQYAGVFRLGDNSEGYTLGDVHTLSGWGSYSFADWISASLRVIGTAAGDIDGRDAQLNPMMVPTADADNHGGERINIALGLNLAGQTGTLRGHRLGVELSAPVYQNLNGPQMEGQYMLMIGWQKAF